MIPHLAVWGYILGGDNHEYKRALRHSHIFQNDDYPLIIQNNMSNDPTRKKKRQATSLAPLLHFMEGSELAVELKNGKVYRGTLQSADAFMNLVLHQVHSQGGDSSAAATFIHRSEDISAAVTTTTTSSTHSDPPDEELSLEDYDLVHIRGPTIRYIHFTEIGLDIPAKIKEGQNRKRAAEDRYRRGKRK